MASNRHNRIDADAVLDAARDSILAVGVRRTTLTDVARRAGVSRMSIYRRWPDVRTLFRELMTREWLAVATETMAGADGTRPVRDQLIDGIVVGVRGFREHPLFLKIVDVDPELLLPYMLNRLGASQEGLLKFIEAILRNGHADGSVRVEHAPRQARTVLLVAQSFTFSLRTVTDEDDPELTARAFYQELHDFLDRALAP
ncbi:TetR/AcrR family transcriptional regulator [Actinomadura craniellae]|uniref:TetR/AcrR family transcriptional regulator n=1 Tax=Actinomadura craniellae TaxID=2231787 RepID=A0A365H6K1_9ACTN|nr:TetR/AcrR family transcriptional regulator [Actinomadura craniellae]RAY14669.1 TetR/AcrR family transcriptional regulator [Actinomadura craniellae]